MDRQLPPLPEPSEYSCGYGCVGGRAPQDIFTADQLRAFAEEAVKQEREACAQECERVYGSDERGAKACAVLIRARSQEGQG
jgi:hypothetical protein